MSLHDYMPLCDVRGCGEPQSGEPVELLLEASDPPLWIRVHPCDGHRAALYKRVPKVPAH